jgi:hypothetical protein
MEPSDGSRKNGELVPNMQPAPAAIESADDSGVTSRKRRRHHHTQRPFRNAPPGGIYFTGKPLSLLLMAKLSSKLIAFDESFL